MFIKPNLSVFHSASVLAGALICASCAAPGLDQGAEAQPRSLLEAQAEKQVSPSELPSEAQTQTSERVPLRAGHPGNMRVSMDHAARTLTVQVTFDACKSGGFVYEKNSLEVEVDHTERRVILTGFVEYLEQIPADPMACKHQHEPIVFVSEDAEPAPYLITNMSAWMGRGGNGIQARVRDFRTPEQVEADKQNCLTSRESDIGNISGVWFLQSDPFEAMALSGSASMLNPQPVVRTWSGSVRPFMIEAEKPYAFDLPAFGRTVFQSSTCALIQSPNSDEPTDLLIRQTPEGL